MRFITDNPAHATKRGIARAFGVKGETRILLKSLIKELKEEGLIEQDAKHHLSPPGALPPVLMCEVTGRDRENNLIAEPVEWGAEDGPRPRLLVMTPPQRRRGPGLSLGLGERFLGRTIDTSTDTHNEFRGAIRPIKRLERTSPDTMGVVRREKGEVLILPTDKKRAPFLLDPRQAEEVEEGDFVLVEAPLRSGRHSPLARLKRRIGKMTSEHAFALIAIHAHQLPHVFSSDTLAEAEAAHPVTRTENREDWRDLPLITIDPRDAKDHDDAVHASADLDPANAGGFIVTVAIADVAHYVRPGSALDREALLRGNSVYFPTHVIPMLPERISNDLCSLKEGADRPALAARMIFDRHGHKRAHRFHRIMMRSHARLSYEEAQAAMDGAPNARTLPLRETILEPLYAAYRALSHSRSLREPLELNLPERKLILKSDGTIERVEIPPRLDAHRLIEEFMIQANVAASETLEKARLGFLYRVHDQPSPAKLETLRAFLGKINFTLTRKEKLEAGLFNRVLAQATRTDYAHLVNDVVLRAQAQAEYSPVNIGHFGLNLKSYAHFTSPIRRYADLIVHRALIRALGLGDDGLPDDSLEQLEAIGSAISAAERRAMTAERETVDRLIASWLAERVGAVFHGRIAGVAKAGLFVKLDESGADGFVPAATLGVDYYAYDEGHHALIGERSGETYQLGMPVTVRLVEALPFAGALRFEMVSEGSMVRKKITRKKDSAKRRKKAKNT